jgi:CDP-glucose 4,6-dehydratase
MGSYWKGKAVLITGATGFVGFWLAKHLVEEEAHVVALVRDWDPNCQLIRTGLVSKIQVVSANLTDFAGVERALSECEVDTVFHLGAQAIVGVAHRSPLLTFESNIRGTFNVLEACRVHKKLVKRVVVASSDKAYGAGPALPYSEDMPLQGQHPYDVSKSCVDLLAQCYWHTYELPVVIARCGNIYGGGDLNWSRIVPGTIRSLLQDKAPIIRSDGKFIRDYVYVEDAVQAYLLLARSIEERATAGEAFNFGPEKPMTVLEIVGVIQQVMGRSDFPPVVLDEVVAEIRDQYLCSRKAREKLGWEPAFSVAEGLARTVSWYREYLGG